MKITVIPVTLAQAASLAGLYPRLSLASAYEAWQTRKAVRQSFTARSKKEALLRDFEGDKTALDLARDGFYDEFYGEWSGSETVGPMPRWITSTHRASEVRVSPNSLARARFFLMVALLVPTIRANALRNARVQLDEMFFVADGHRDLVTMYDGTDDRDMGPDVMAWLKRDPSHRQVINRWGRPDDEQEFLELIRDGGSGMRLRAEYGTGREAEWNELMVDFRRRKLDGLLKEYFGLDDYRASMIVLKWEKSSSGRWRPAKQMNVVDWVKWSCETSGSVLGGLQSCTLSIQKKTQLRKRKETKNALLAERDQDEVTTHTWA